MEAVRPQVRGTEEAGEREWGGGGVLRALVQRRAEKRMRQLTRGMRRRTRAFGRGALVGYAIQENPGRAVILSFIIGAVLGAVGHALRQSTDEFHEMIEEADTLEGAPEPTGQRAA